MGGAWPVFWGIWEGRGRCRPLWDPLWDSLRTTWGRGSEAGLGAYGTIIHLHGSSLWAPGFLLGLGLVVVAHLRGPGLPASPGSCSVASPGSLPLSESWFSHLQKFCLSCDVFVGDG